MLLVIVLVFVLGAAAVAVGLVLFLAFGFERFVGLRYLLRARRSDGVERRAGDHPLLIAGGVRGAVRRARAFARAGDRWG